MSCRGTWMTDRIYCRDCLDGLERVSNEMEQDKWLSCGDVKNAQMYAGRISSTYDEGVFNEIEEDLFSKFKKYCCHGFNVTVTSEGGDSICMEFKPDPAVTSKYERRLLSSNIPLLMPAAKRRRGL